MTCLDFAEREKIQGLKNLNVPNLRFPEFTEEWTQCTIGSYGNIITGSTPSTSDTENYDNGTYLWASPTDLGELKYVEQTQTKLTDKGFGKTRRFPANSIMVTCIGSTIGKMGMSKVEMSTNQQINTIVPTGHDANFVFYTIQSRFPRYLSSIAVQAVPIISKSAFEKLENYTTSIDEEVKIGTFLSLLDERIATKIKIIEQLQSLIKGICNNLLYADKGKSIRLGDILIERKEKSIINNQYEILSSTVKGVFSQRDYFSKDIASENNIGYKIIRLNDIVLSPQNLWMGNINFNDKYEIGIVSPSYKIFAIKENFNKIYIANLLKTHRALYNYMQVSEQGASIVRRNLNLEAFEQLSFKIPDYQEQCRIARILISTQQKIQLETSLLNKYEELKKFLLSNMFI